ncbi:MAG: nucleoside triphosphate pyrophosphohydrolase [Acidobacteria bacterium]|nr:nucleoside triphosphate pyrophosphohydrolase [Acidobacteriota bacterium]
MEPSSDLSQLLTIMARLRTPEIGCPWDMKQSFETIAPYTIEEAYEVADAIARNDMGDLKDELGDLLLQVVFHARIAEEQHAFTFDDVVFAITEKLIRRHPHVFGAERDLAAEDVKQLWEKIKAEERKNKPAKIESILDNVPLALPALSRSEKIQKRAAQAGFDWPDVAGVIDKIREEIAELQSAKTKAETEEEFGDLLFSLVNYARRASIDPETALRKATEKFERRFRGVERRAAANGKAVEQSSLDELEAYWQAEKQPNADERKP